MFIETKLKLYHTGVYKNIIMPKRIYEDIEKMELFENDHNKHSDQSNENSTQISKQLTQKNAESLVLSKILKLKTNSNKDEILFLTKSVDLLNELILRVSGKNTKDQFYLSQNNIPNYVNKLFNTSEGIYYLAYSKEFESLFSSNYLHDILEIIDTLFSNLVLDAKMLSEIVATEKKERERLARDLHDGACQELVSISLNLKNRMFKLDFSDSELESHISKLDSIIYNIRRLSYNLKPLELESNSLSSVVKNLCQEMSKIAKVEFTFSSNIGNETFGSRDLIIYRVIQECINNIIKHSSASESEISIFKINSQELHVSISDNGKGFSYQKIKPGMGLNNIKNRIMLAGGEVQINSEEGKGTQTFIKFTIS